MGIGTISNQRPGQRELQDWLSAQALQGVMGTPERMPMSPNSFMPAGGSPLYDQAFGLGQQLPGQMEFDPNQITNAMQPVGDFAQNMFQQETIPGIMGALGATGQARSSGAAEILGREGRNLGMGLGAQFGPMQYQGYQSALNRQQQLPQQLAALGGMQYGVGDIPRQWQENRWQQGQIDPRLQFINPGLNQAMDTVVKGGQAGTDWGAGLMGMGGNILAGMAMGGPVGGLMGGLGGALFGR